MEQKNCSKNYNIKPLDITTRKQIYKKTNQCKIKICRENTGHFFYFVACGTN